MGNVMHGCMTTSEDNVYHQLQDKEVPAITYREPTSEAVAPVVQNKEKVNQEIVPFEPNFEYPDVPDFDLMAIMNDIEKEQENQPKSQVSVATTTSNVLNNIPKSMFANCTIQNVTFNIKN